jgi:hypothetical protein
MRKSTKKQHNAILKARDKHACLRAIKLRQVKKHEEKHEETSKESSKERNGDALIFCKLKKEIRLIAQKKAFIQSHFFSI